MLDIYVPSRRNLRSSSEKKRKYFQLVIYALMAIVLSLYLRQLCGILYHRFVEYFTTDVIKTRLPFSINFFLDFTVHKRSIFKIFTSMNLRNGSVLKPYNKLAVRVLSDIKHSAIASCLYT